MDIVNRAFLAKELFVIKAKSDSYKIFAEVVARLLGAVMPEEIEFSHYMKRLSLRNLPDYRNVSSLLALKNRVNTDLSVIEDAYFMAIESKQSSDILKEFSELMMRRNMAEALENAEELHTLCNDAEGIIDRLIGELKLKTQEEYQNKNRAILNFIADVKEQDLQKYLRPWDGTRAFIHKGTAIIDLDSCIFDEDTEIVADRYIVIGAPGNVTLELFAEEAGENVADYGEESHVETGYLSKAGLFRHLMDKMDVMELVNDGKIGVWTECGNIIRELRSLGFGNKLVVGSLSEIYRHSFDVLYLVEPDERLMNIAQSKANGGELWLVT